MNKSLLDLSTDEKYEHCKQLINTISQRLINAIHLSEMCDVIIFSERLSKQIPPSYAGHHFSLLQRTLIKQLALNLLTLWDIFHRERYEDRVSFPTIIELIDEDVILLAEQRSYQHWHDGVEQQLLGSYYESLTPEQLLIEGNRLKRERAEALSRYVRPCIEKVVDRVPKFMSSELITTMKKFRNRRLAHHLEPIASKKSPDIEVTINWDHPKKLLIQSLWCCHNLSLGLTGVDQNFRSSFEVAKIYSDDLWDNCHFDIPNP